MLFRILNKASRTRMVDLSAHGYTLSERGQAARQTRTTSCASAWGWLPTISLLCALGLLSMAIAHSGSRAGSLWAESLFWVSLLVIGIPISARLIGAAASRRERIGLVAMLGFALYLVKVLHSPVAFTFSDELIHLYNVQEILQNEHLFAENPIIPASPLYPGLSSVTAALVSLSGLSSFSAGLIVVGVARLVISLALFLFWEELSRSAHVAGVAAILYIAHSNYLFWSAQFAYESLGLPLASLVLFSIVRRTETQDRTDYVGLTFMSTLVLLAVVMTHHLTSYALTTFLIAGALIYRMYGRHQAHLTGFALVALLAGVSWLLYLASLTISYLSPVLGGAVRSILEMIFSERGLARQLFRSDAGNVAPLWEQGVALGSVVLLLLGMPFGIIQVWRAHRGKPLVVLLSGAGLLYFVMLGFRLTGQGWEISNRTSAFLYVGLALVLAMGFLEYWRIHTRGWVAQGLCIAYVMIVFFGGVIVGWMPAARLAQPYIVAGETLIEPQGVVAARWMHDYIGPDQRIATDLSNARLMLAYGEQYPFTGTKYGIKSMLLSKYIGLPTSEILQRTDVAYVVIDQRRISWDNMVGLYFNRTQDGSLPQEALFEPYVLAKFDQQMSVHKVLDSGNIAIYAVGGLHQWPTEHVSVP